MKTKSFPLKPLAQASAALALAGSTMVLSPSLLAATAAGTEIKNLATVTYEDSAGNSYSAQSNEAVVTVAQVYSATIGSDLDVNAAAGQQVYLPFVLENTGNGTDTFQLGAINGITGGDNIDSSSIAVYHDTNGNGQPDAGEPLVSSITLAAGGIANLVVSVQVPTTATANQTLGVTLTAQALEGTGAAIVGSVADLTAGGGRDTLDDTNESLLTISDDAVLVVTKSSTHDAAANEITYTVTVKNNGSSSANDVVIFDGLPENTALVSSSVSGLLASNGDTLDTSGVLDEISVGRDLNGDNDASDATEADLGFDLNTDGDTLDSNVEGVFAVDAELAANATVTLVYTVSYDPAALGGGYAINNVAHSAGDLDGDGLADDPVDSNQVTDVIDQAYGVTITDTGIDAAASVNDGGDDDATGNDDQLVDSIAAGGVVQFLNVISNTGNGDDIFELSVNPGNFPTGTVFTYWDATGSVQLTDTNSFSGVDSGLIASGGSKTIMVKASLPAGVSGDDNGNEFQATVTATSAGDPSGTPASDTVDESLTEIVDATADIHNSANGVIGSDEDPLGTPEYSAITTLNADAGTTVNLPLFIDNESGGADSYLLGVGGSWDGTTLGGMHPGWSVEFFEVDANGDPTGPAITSTPSMPGGTVDYPIVAVVSIPGGQVEAVGDFSGDNDVDGSDELMDGNGDGDGDYPLFFTILSNNSGATDITMDAIDVEASRAIALTPTSTNQIEAGGTVTYAHTLANSGNTPETVEVEATNSQVGWTSTVLIDTDGDGVADTELGNLTAGNITVQQSSGVDIVIAVTDTDGDGNPELALPSGADIPLQATVFAPASASPGQVDTLTIDAINVDTTAGAPSASALDQTTVINGQVRLDKTVAVDYDCDTSADTPFETVQTTLVEPGQCAVWRIEAENQGATDAFNVTISDSVTAYTTFVANSLRYCTGQGCAPVATSDAPSDDAGGLIGGNIVFYAGTGSDPATGQGGTLVAGEKATAHFTVKVD